MIKPSNLDWLLSTFCAFIFGTFGFCSLAGAETAIPPHTAPVVDQVGMLSQNIKTQLNTSLENLYQQGGSQVAVLIVQTLDGEEIEGFSIRVVEQWKLGSEKNDNGILLLFSIQDRQMRIEVGGGLEGELTDLVAKRIIDGDIVPRMRQQDYDGAVVAGLRGILSRTDPQFDLINSFPQAAQLQQSQQTKRFPVGIILFLILWFLGFLFSFIGRGRGRGGFSRGGWGGGGSGGFGGGFGGGGFGGGFSGGGGGGFSGGGASGRW